MHYKFWINKKWSAYYRNQIASANKLLQKYSPEAIVKALNSDKAKKIYSLRAPHLIPIIEQQEEALSKVNQVLSKTVDRKQDKTFEQSKSAKKNILSKLKESS